MQKNKLIYLVYKVTPKKDFYASLKISIFEKENDATYICIHWHFNPKGKASSKWKKSSLEWKSRDYKLLPLLNKMKKAGIGSSSTPTEVIKFLRSADIEQGSKIELDNDNSILPFRGYVSKSEIFKGTFKRGYYRHVFLIPKKKKEQLIKEMGRDKKVKLKQLLNTVKPITK